MVVVGRVVHAEVVEGDESAVVEVGALAGGDGGVGQEALVALELLEFAQAVLALELGAGGAGFDLGLREG